MKDKISQIAIGILGPVAIFLLAYKNPWGFIVGFCSQPFFLIVTAKNKQWGMFVAAIAYTISWLLGIYEAFLK